MDTGCSSATSCTSSYVHARRYLHILWWALLTLGLGLSWCTLCSLCTLYAFVCLAAGPHSDGDHRLWSPCDGVHDSGVELQHLTHPLLQVRVGPRQAVVLGLKVGGGGRVGGGAGFRCRGRPQELPPCVLAEMHVCQRPFLYQGSAVRGDGAGLNSDFQRRGEASARWPPWRGT